MRRFQQHPINIIAFLDLCRTKRLKVSPGAFLILALFLSILVNTDVVTSAPVMPFTYRLPAKTALIDIKSSLWSPSLQGTAWNPPPLENPITIDIPADTTRRLVVNLDVTKDYIINMPSTPLQAGLALVGGHNVVLIGGEISIPWQGDDASIGDRTMLLIRGATGIVHIEGLLGGGEDISEGIQIDAPDAIVQLQNIRIDNVHARDQEDFSDNHPDLIQTYGNVKELRIDGFTGSSDYQGFFLVADYNGPHGTVIASRINIIGEATARYLWWLDPEEGAGTVSLNDVWIDVPPERDGGLSYAVWPDAYDESSDRAQLATAEAGYETISWPFVDSSAIIGTINEGTPSDGDFVPADSVGIGYQRSVASNEQNGTDVLPDSTEAAVAESQIVAMNLTQPETSTTPAATHMEDAGILPTIIALTPTASATPSATPTLSLTPLPTPTFSLTPSPSPTATLSLSATATTAATRVLDAGILSTPTPLPPPTLTTVPTAFPSTALPPGNPVEVPSVDTTVPATMPTVASPSNEQPTPVGEPTETGSTGGAPPAPTNAPVSAQAFVASEPGLSCSSDRVAVSIQGSPTTITRDDPSRRYSVALDNASSGELQIATMAGHPDNRCFVGSDNDSGRYRCDQGQENEEFNVLLDANNAGFVGDNGEDRWDVLVLSIPELTSGSHEIEIRHTQGGSGVQSVAFKAVLCVAAIIEASEQPADEVGSGQTEALIESTDEPQTLEAFLVTQPADETEATPEVSSP